MNRLLIAMSLGWGALAHAGVVEEWNARFIEAVRKETPPPCLVSRNLPIFHLCMKRAVEGVDDDLEARVDAAARMAFELLFPSQRNAPLLENKKTPQWFAEVSAVVKRTFEERRDDGASTTVHYVPKVGPGQWQRTPPKFRPPELPHWGLMRPFVITDVEALRAPGPPKLGSPEYLAELEEVRVWGGKGSGKRSAEETMIARFWSDFSYTTSPAGHWNDIARTVSLQRKLGTKEAAALFVTLNVALADTCIVCWNTKYHFNYWRPVTAIRQTEPDWEPLLVTPPHPEHVSGHSAISGAGSAVLEHCFGKEVAEFEVASDEVKDVKDVKDVKRRFTSFSACAEEISRSRVLGGIHFPSACREGLKLGRAVAAQVMDGLR